MILHLHKRRFAELFDDKALKVAFQNRLLIYLLYKCGRFVPVFTDPDLLDRHGELSAIDKVASMHGIPKEQIIRRHGTETHENLQKSLSPPCKMK